MAKKKATARNDRAVAYIRVSTVEQSSEGVSLDQQRAQLTAYAVAKGLHLVEIISEEGVSAGLPLVERDGGRRLLSLLADGAVHHVIATKLDRVFRNVVDCLSTVQEWNAANVGLHALDLSIDTTTAQGKAFLGIVAVFAEMERGLISDRTRTALQHKKDSGKIYNHPPYGYVRVGDELVPDPGEQLVLSRIADGVAAGLFYAEIARRLNAEGFTTKSGKPWSRMNVHGIAMQNGLLKPPKEGCK